MSASVVGMFFFLSLTLPVLAVVAGLVSLVVGRRPSSRTTVAPKAHAHI